MRLQMLPIMRVLLESLEYETVDREKAAHYIHELSYTSYSSNLDDMVARARGEQTDGPGYNTRRVIIQLG